MTWLRQLWCGLWHGHSGEVHDESDGSYVCPRCGKRWDGDS